MNTTELKFPPPWQLTGNGLILLLRLNRRWREKHGLHEYQGPIGALMCVDYKSSPVGGYREILFIPGRLQNSKGNHFSIHTIYVDSEDSMIGGQQNWGIPKDLAVFEWSQHTRTQQVTISKDSASATIQLKGLPIKFPINSSLIPLTIFQQRHNELFWTKPTAKGLVELASVKHIDFTDFPGIPPLSRQQILSAVSASRFTMEFPPAVKSVN